MAQYSNDLEIYASTDTTGYPISIATEMELAKPSEIVLAQGIS